MRKVIVSMNVSLDGFMSGTDCELDWHFQSWTSDMAESLCEQLNRADTILLGRVTYMAMARYWPAKARDVALHRDDIAFADMMNHYTKIVFSKTLHETAWNNTKLVKGDLAAAIIRLKQESGKDMIVYGSGRIVSALLKSGLVDEFKLWIHPVALGKGKPLFKSLQRRLYLELTETHTFHSGVVLLCYTLKP